MNRNTALLIIDQQKGIDFPHLGERNNPEAETVILELLTQWRKEQWPVIHVKHRSRELGSIFWPEQKGFDFKPETAPLAGEPIIEKSTPCAFTHTRLEQLIADLSIQTLVLTGVVTNNSIESTARTGGNLGYDLKIVHDACFTFAKDDYFGQKRTAEEVHAMSLANIEGEYAGVTHSSLFLPKNP